MSELPIVYVPGFASEGFGPVYYPEDPFYGFNVGARYVRIDAYGHEILHRFEGPLLRLMVDHGYHLILGGVDQLTDRADASVPPRTVWFHQYYDITSTSRADGASSSIEASADDLLSLVELVRRKTSAMRVHLVAHSAGGLVCRCLIQKIMPERGLLASDIIDRLFTYATPHGGMTGGFQYGSWRESAFPQEIERSRMWEYLTPGAERRDGPPSRWMPHDMPPEAFPLDRIFCLVGTMSDDLGLRRAPTSGTEYLRSDGRIPFESAYVPGAPNAFVHRSHGGQNGIVNSEEGYENLRRFLFGNLRVDFDLVGIALPKHERIGWQAEIEVAVHGLPVMVHQQTVGNACPVLLWQGNEDDAWSRPVLLATMYVFPEDPVSGRSSLRFALRVRIISIGVGDWSDVHRDNMVGAPDFDDLLVMDVVASEGRAEVWARWKSTIGPLRDYEPEGLPLADEDPEVGRYMTTIPLPGVGRDFLGPEAAVHCIMRNR